MFASKYIYVFTLSPGVVCVRLECGRSACNFLAKCRIDCAFHFEYFPLHFPHAAVAAAALRNILLCCGFWLCMARDYGKVFRLALPCLTLLGHIDGC